MRNSWKVFCLITIAVVFLSSCGTSETASCPSLITASLDGNEVYRHEGTAWYSYYYSSEKGDYVRGFLEGVGPDTIKQELLKRTANFLSVLGIQGIEVDFFDIQYYYAANQTEWTSDGSTACGEFVKNYELTADFSTESFMNQNKAGPMIITEDYGSYVSFVVQSNIAQVGDGASLKFSLSKEKLIPLLVSSYNNSDMAVAVGEIEERHFGSDQEYGEALLQAIQNGEKHEIVYFNFPVEDYAGRTYMIKIMPNILGILAPDYPGYMAVMNGQLSTKLNVTTSLSMRSGRITTRKFFLGSSMSFAQTTSMEDVVDGSIFFVK